MFIMGIVGEVILPIIFGPLIDLFKTKGLTSVSDHHHAYWIFLPALLCLIYFAVKTNA